MSFENNIIVPKQYLHKYSKEEINEFPVKQYDGSIFLINSSDQMTFVDGHLKNENILGFDTETKPSFKKGKVNPPSLLQLATDQAVFIFQISKKFFPDIIQSILSDPEIIKSGVAVRDDITGLKRLSDFSDAGFVDIGEISKSIGLQTNGLRNLAVNLLGFRISKSCQKSNWGKKKLSQQQILYAATDAWVSRKLFVEMKCLKFIDTLNA
ncbi:MAG: 3'-5' exonuclease domain-containing protein 2 [Candidatus Magnetomorum sp.]|nr:3'-5' exonuclease domain-containing protein 2 [Candidatus Magnetomorum sp.]